ncbi:hypothetical protein XI06_17110 [Bradyrhizobium sp. CCBAU 11434]|nr:hypothetical protein [Bradyrhizobium sp. CCBAU 11434]
MADPLAGYSIFCREFLQCWRRIGQLARSEDVSLARTKRLDSGSQRLSALDQFVFISQLVVLCRRGVYKPFYRFVGVRIVVSAGIQGYVAAQAPVHVYYLSFRHLEARSNCLNLLRMQISVLDSRDRTLSLP